MSQTFERDLKSRYCRVKMTQCEIAHRVMAGAENFKIVRKKEVDNLTVFFFGGGGRILKLIVHIQFHRFNFFLWKQACGLFEPAQQDLMKAKTHPPKLFKNTSCTSSSILWWGWKGGLPFGCRRSKRLKVSEFISLIENSPVAHIKSCSAFN